MRPRGGAGRTQPHAGRAHCAAAPLFPQDVPPDLRAGDQPAPPARQPQRAPAHDDRGHRRQRPRRRLRGDAEAAPALCQRTLHRLRRLRARREREDPQPLQLRPRRDRCGAPAARHGLPAALRARPLDHRHARGRQGPGGVQGRRHRPDDDRADAVAERGQRDLGHRLEALRRRTHPALRLRALCERADQPGVRAPGRPGRAHRRPAAAAVRRSAARASAAWLR